MNWEFIGKLSFAFVCTFAVVGIIYLIIGIVSWKRYVDTMIELQTKVNEELLKALKDIGITVEEAISEERSEEYEEHSIDIPTNVAIVVHEDGTVSRITGVKI